MFKTRKSDRKTKGLSNELEELATTLRAYAVQEIFGPLRGIGRFIGFGLAGSIFVSLSFLLGGLGLLRLLQAEVLIFKDTWSFVPYLIAAAAMLLVLAALIGAVTRLETKSDPESANAMSTNTAIGPESEHAK